MLHLRNVSRWLNHLIFDHWFSHPSRKTRLCVRREFCASIPLAVVTGVLGTTFCGIVGRKGLHFSNTMIDVLMACNLSGLLFSGILIGFFHKTRKVSAYSKILTLLSLLLISICFIPGYNKDSFLGPYLFIFLILAAQTCLALAFTIRSSLWRANYPTNRRGKIVVFIYLCITCCSSIVLAFAWAMDNWNIPFQIIYLIAGLAGLLAAWLMSHIKVSRESQSLRNAGQSRQPALLAGLAVLWEDKRFGKFMAWQMLNGFATLVIETSVLVYLLTDVFNRNYYDCSIIAVIPLVVSGFSGIIWSRLFDKKDIYIMRFYGANLWAFSRLVLMLGVYLHSFEIVIISRFFTGIGMGVGQLTWRLGHMAFAPPEKDSLYMGAHISLTGLRGMLAPFVGTYLYYLECMGQNGVYLIGISALCQITAGVGFLAMRKSVKINS